MKIYKVTFEIFHRPPNMPIPLFFHPSFNVEARSHAEAEERGQVAFNSHPDNVEIKREIVEIKVVKRPEDESLILKLEDK